MKGNSASITRVFPYAAIEFYSMEFYKNILIRNKKDSLSLWRNFACGILSGINAVTVTFPLDVARTRLSINTPNSDLKETGLFRTIFFLFRKEGIIGIYKGYTFAFFVIKFFFFFILIIFKGLDSLCCNKANYI